MIFDYEWELESGPAPTTSPEIRFSTSDRSAVDVDWKDQEKKE